MRAGSGRRGVEVEPSEPQGDGAALPPPTVGEGSRNGPTGPEESPLAAAYRRGVRLLEGVESMLRNAPEDGHQRAYGKSGRLSFAVGTVGREASDRLAQELVMDQAALRAEAQFAEAVAVIARNCGESATRAILSPGCRLKAKEVETISRMAPERQRYEMGQVAQGRRPFLKPAEGIPPLDTERFAEVENRLARALGLLDWNLRDVPRMPDHPRPTPAEQEKIRDRAERIIASAQGLLRLLTERGTAGPPRTAGMGRGDARRQAPAEGQRPLKTRTYSDVVGRLGPVLGLVEKNVRDIPRLPDEVRPTREEVRVIGEQVQQISKGSQELLRLVSGRGTA